jgi:hypothetical protein
MDPLRVLQVGLGGWGRDWAQRVIPGQIFWTSRDDEGAGYDRVVIQKPDGMPRVI